MTRPDSDAAPYDPVLEQTAQAWLVRLRGTPDAATRRAFEDWLAQRPAHAEAYARAEALWRLTEIPASRLAIEEADALEAYLRPRRASRNPRRWAYRWPASPACWRCSGWAAGGSPATGCRTGVPTMSPRRDRSPNGSWPMAPT